MINWTINAYDLLAIIGAALLLYGRLVTLETKVTPLWDEFVTREPGADRRKKARS